MLGFSVPRIRRALDPRRRALKKAQAIVARYVSKERDLVQELIDERRQEAAREERELDQRWSDAER